MEKQASVILGGDPFSDIFRGLYNLKRFWKLTDPDYCLSVMEGAYQGGCRAFDYSFRNVQEIYLRLMDRVDEEIVGYGNPTYLQGCKLGGTHLQFLRSRVLATLVERPGFLPVEIREKIRDDYRENLCMVFGYDRNAKPLSDEEIQGIYIDEDTFAARLSEVNASKYVLVGGTDADWLVSLGRIDLIGRLVEIVRGKGQIPLLLCHYTSVVLPAADEMQLDVEGYFAAVNKQSAWLDKETAVKAVQEAKKPVTAFMAFASGGLASDMEGAARYLRDVCHVNGIMYGTTRPENACKTAELLNRVFKEQSC